MTEELSVIKAKLDEATRELMHYEVLEAQVKEGLAEAEVLLEKIGTDPKNARQMLVGLINNADRAAERAKKLLAEIQDELNKRPR